MITLEKKPGYIGREQLVTQMVSKLGTCYSWFQLMTPEVGIGALLKGDNVYCRKLGRSFQATPDHVRIILKLEIRQ